MSETPAATSAPVASAPTHAAGLRFREYESIFLLRPDLADDLVEKAVERMRSVVNRGGGKVLKVTYMGKKKTAFVVKKHPRANFLQFQYLGDAKMVAEFERNLRMTDDVLKYQSVRVGENIDPNSRAIEADVKLPGDIEAPERLARDEERPQGGSDRDLPGDDAEVPELE